MDRLDEMYNMQAIFEEKIWEDDTLQKHSDKFLLKWNKEFILALMKESSELLDSVNWKTHEDTNEEVFEDNFLENCVDVMKYLFALMYLNNIDTEHIYQKFMSKSVVVNAKYMQNKLMKTLQEDKERKIAILDIDGVLADYPGDFIDYFNYTLKSSHSTLDEVKKDRETYERIKSSYRAYGRKKDMGVKQGAIEFTHKLSDLGYTIILLTARPYEKYLRIYQDTLQWLRKNDIKHDAIIWDREKAKYIIKNLKNNNVVFCVEDEIPNALELSPVFPTYLMRNRKLYNPAYFDGSNEERIMCDSGIMVIDSLKEIEI